MKINAPTIAFTASAILAMSPAAIAKVIDSHAYLATGIEYGYVHAFPAFMTQAERQAIAQVAVELARSDDVLVAPAAGLPAVQLTLGQVTPDNPVVLHESALPVIASALRQHLQSRHNAPFFVAVDPADVDTLTGQDIRRPHRTAIGFRIEYTGPTSWVTEFTPLYTFPDLPGQPSIAELMDVRVPLVRLDDASYVAWRPAGIGERITLSLGEIADRPAEAYTAAAVQQVLVAIRDELTDRGLMGVAVAPSDEDLRGATTAAQARPVRVVVTTGVVSEIRTLAAGPRIPAGPERLNNPVHQRIINNSPIRSGDPLQRDVLDRYVFWLARHPGRRIDVGLAPGVEPNTLGLDYLVTENRPLILYAQASNTGTRQTGRWRQRFGLYHSQLTNNDDIFNIDYNTAGFDDSHIVTGFYEAPFFNFDRIRWRMNGLWSEYDASEVGLTGFRFTGETWSVGGEVIANIFQDRQLFVDVVGGTRYLNAEVGQEFFGLPIGGGNEDFFLPYAGLRMDRITDLATTRGSIITEFSVPGVTSVDDDELAGLGRFEPDRRWVTLQWDLLHSFFLEPALNPEGWRDPMTPQTSTLAHELAMGFRGQYAFDRRLIPQTMMIAGGFYTVRGYPEAVTSGDTVLLGTLEYRFHLPRALSLGEPGEFLGQPFRWQPQHVYGRTDWNLIFRGFLDVGRTIHSDRRAFEEDNTLVGVGVGAELQIKRNLNLRVDWGVAAKAIDTPRVRSGSNRVHFVGTILY